jgi:hypothetical protein
MFISWEVVGESFKKNNSWRYIKTIEDNSSYLHIILFTISIEYYEADLNTKINIVQKIRNRLAAHLTSEILQKLNIKNDLIEMQKILINGDDLPEYFLSYLSYIFKINLLILNNNENKLISYENNNKTIILSHQIKVVNLIGYYADKSIIVLFDKDDKKLKEL